MYFTCKKRLIISSATEKHEIDVFSSPKEFTGLLISPW